MEQIKRVLANWNVTDFVVKKRYHEQTERILCCIETEADEYVLGTSWNTGIFLSVQLESGYVPRMKKS